jgi:hypothetical protein
MAGRESGESGPFRNDRSEGQPALSGAVLTCVSPGPPKRLTQLSTPHLLAGHVSGAEFHGRVQFASAR